MYNDNADGYRTEMTSAEVMETYNPADEKDGVWIASRFGPVVSHEIKPFRTKKEAYRWCVEDMKNAMVDEMCSDCWQDVGGTGTEWEVRFMDSMTDNSVKSIGELSLKEIESQITSVERKLRELKALWFQKSRPTKLGK